MDTFNREMKGVLFFNDFKKTETQPDLKGKIQINGQEYQISAWKKTNSRGDFFKLDARLPTNQTSSSRPQLDDDSPF